MVYPLLPAYVIGTLGGTATTLGALDGAADLTAAVTKWISGRLADNSVFRTNIVPDPTLTQRLAQKGVRFDGATRQVGEMVKLATFYDPDGNTLMLAEQLDGNRAR